MGINTNSDIIGELSIGVTDRKMVRIFVAGDNVEIPMDFTAEEAQEIAQEILAAVDMCTRRTRKT